jgi:rubrerythrin
LNLNELFAVKHELWLKYLFASFAIKDGYLKDKMYDFAMIEFRHLKWISFELKEKGIDYDYNRSMIDIKKESLGSLIEFLIEETKFAIKQYDINNPLFARILNDEYFFLSTFEGILDSGKYDEQITAFNKKRVYEDKKLDETSTDALTLFLFEETYKEYELILVYSYMQNYTDDKELSMVYQDLVDESMFHLKSFGNMLGIMGLLSIPRIVPKEIYKVEDIKQFLLDGIDEEKAAKEECKKLAEAVKDEELSKFFDLINYQEDYHIKLMEKIVNRV